MTMKQQVSQRVWELENELGIDLDAVMHKVTQETMELIEALEQQDKEEIISELGDALFNTLSVAHRLDIQLEESIENNGPYSSIDIAIQLGKVNNTIQKHR
jgi:NTP pyrophosphatase (non-canonical NTP hydrolase)